MPQFGVLDKELGAEPLGCIVINGDSVVANAEKGESGIAGERGSFAYESPRLPLFFLLVGVLRIFSGVFIGLNGISAKMAAAEVPSH